MAIGARRSALMRTLGAVLMLAAAGGALLVLLAIMDGFTRRWWRWAPPEQKNLELREEVARRALLDADPDLARELESSE